MKREDAGWAAAAVVGSLLAVWPLAFGLPMAHDIAIADWWHDYTGYATSIALHARAFAAPHWMAGPHLGSNLAGQIEGGPFYPPGWLLFPVLGPFFGLIALYGFHLVVGTLGAFVLARVGGRTPGAAAFMGVAYGASGFVVAHVKHPNIVGSSVWLPWALTGVLLAGARPWPALPVLTLATAAAWFPGHPQIAYYATFVVAAATVLNHARAPRVLASCVAAIACGGLLAALPVLPTLALAQDSFRSTTDWAFASRHGFDLFDLAFFVVPSLRGSPYAGTWAAFEPSALPWEDYAYVGLSTLALAAFAVVKEPRARALAGLAILGILFAAGPLTPLYHAAWTVLPGLDAFRFPQRALWLVGLALAWLAAQGLDRAAPNDRVRALALAVLVLDLALAHAPWLPTVPFSSARATPLVQAARADVPAPRVYVLDTLQDWTRTYGTGSYEPLVALPAANLASTYDVESPDGYVVLLPEAVSWFWAHNNRDALAFAPVMPGVAADGTLLARRRLERAGVTHVISAREVADLAEVTTAEGYGLYRVPNPWPAAYTVAGWSAGKGVAAWQQADESDVIVFEGVRGNTGDAARVPLTPPPPAETEVYDVAGRTGALVVARAWSPGWTARIDGVDAPVVRANGWQRAVLLPSGAREVVFRFSAPGVSTGAASALLGLLGTAALSVWARRHLPGSP